ncbi:MAG: heavy metal translocating P-type ATPase, partial [Acaryochloris sp. SU_5_25]|nr:heavy metal translocating P-type ATPase [Acaryochloris sp. SU_5_25]
MNALSVSPPVSPATTAILSISGMKCAGCVQAVEKRLQQQPGVSTAVVNLVTAQAAVEYMPEDLTPEDLAQILTTAGFPSQVQDQSSRTGAGLSSGESSVALRQEPIQRLMVATILVILSGLGHLGHLPGLALLGLTGMPFHWGLATVALLGPGR